MPNRRRRKLSTAMSAVAALAVASPFAALAITELSAQTSTAPQHRDFQQAAIITDLPNEILSALSQGLAQFGINLPPLPTGLSPSGAQPLGGLPLGGLTSPGLTSPGLSPSALTTPGLTPGLTTPSVGSPLTGTALTDPGLTGSPLTSPGLTSPLSPALPATGLTPGLATPPVSPDPGLTVPGALPTTPGLGVPTTPGLGLPTTPGLGLPTELPISAPIGLDPMAGTYPILGADPSLLSPVAAAPASTGLLGSLTSAAQQLGVGQVIDLVKGVVMPSIMSAAQQAAPAAAAAVPAALPVG